MSINEILKDVNKEELLKLAKAKDVNGLIEMAKEMGKKFSKEDAKALFAAIAAKKADGVDVASLLKDAMADGKITRDEVIDMAKTFFGKKTD